MKQKSISLSKADNAILESYKVMAEGLANYLGEGYEFVLHSLGNLEHSVIKIINGHHTGRKEGSPITDLGLSMLHNINEKNHENYFTYFNKTAKGEPLKSTSIFIHGEKGNIIGMLCINFYMNTPLSSILETFTQNEDNDQTALNLSESFVEDVDGLLSISLKEASEKVYSDRSIATSNKNKEIIAILNEKGIFNFKDSVVKIAALMGISRNTVYMHIRNIGKK